MEKRCIPALCRRLRGTALALAGALAFLATAAPASAAPDPSCSPAALFDSLGYQWDVTSSAPNDPAWPELANAGAIILDGTTDAYSGFGVLRVDTDGADTGGQGNPNSTVYLPPDAVVCGTEDGGREIVFPEKSVGLLGQLRISRKVYVPSSGLAFARFLDVVRNVGATELTRTISYEGRVGSFEDTRILATSPTPNRWATSGDCAPGAQDPACVPFDTIARPPLAHVWDGPGSLPKAATAVYGGATASEVNPWASSSQEDRVRVVYQGVAIPAGERVVFMHFEAQRPGSAEALTAARALGDVTTGAGFVGLDESLEIPNLKNWNPNDLDGDGLSPSSETALGTSATNSDTDADGRSDGADACPLTSGAGADGCPPPPAAAPPAPTSPAAPPAVRDTTAPKLSLLLPRSVKRRKLMKGLTVIVRANEACSLKVELLGKSRSTRRRVRKFSLPLSSQALPTSGAGTRALRLRPSRRLFRRAARTPVQVRVTAVDRAGNRTVETRSIRVRR